MAEHTLTSIELAALLERLNLQPAREKSPAQVSQAQLDLLLARIASLTEALRGSGSNDSTQVASRMLLSDLALVAAQFRGNANAIGASLSKALEDLRAAIQRFDSPRT